jgi:predicted membrane metal-binding protein
MRRPLTGLVVAYAIGIWLGSLAEVSWPKLLGCAAVWLLVFLVLGRRRYSVIPLLAAIVCAGMFAYQFSTTSRLTIAIDRLVERRDQNVALRGVIVSDPGYREAEGADAEPTGDRHSFKLDLESVNGTPATGRILVFISATRPRSPLRYGDRISCTAQLRVPAPARNPGTFDWQRWLALQNIQFTATFRKIDLCAVLEAGQGNPTVALSLRLREHFERALRAG